MSYVSGRVVDPQWVWELALRSRLSANLLDQIVKGLIYIYLSQYNRIGALGALSGEERTEPTFGFALFVLH